MPWAPICFAVAINSGRVKRSNAELMTHIGLFGLSMSFVYRFRKIFAKKKGCRSGQPSYSVNTLTHILFCVFSFLYFQANRRSEEHTSELQSRENLVCRLLLEKKKTR